MKMMQRLLHALKSRLDRLNDIGSEVIVDPDSWVSGSSLHGRIRISEGCRLYRTTIEGDVTIERYSTLWGPGVFALGRKEGIRIGSFCSIGRFVSLQEDNHHPQRTTTYLIERNLLGLPSTDTAVHSRGPITIGNDVWIGAAAQVLSGVSIGHGAIVAGGAVVTADVAPYAIVAGNPARAVRKRFDTATIDRLLSDAWWDWPLERLRSETDYLINLHSRPD